MTRPLALTLALALVAALGLAAQPARAAFTVTVFPVSAYTADEAAMNATLGITGYAIEGFEDTTLLPGLSVTFGNFRNADNTPSGTPDRTLTVLPDLFDATNPLGLGPNQWDGTRALVNSSGGDNVFDDIFTGNPPIAALTTFNVTGGTTSVGVGLSNFQSLSTPANQFPITDHDLVVNGLSLGTIESLAGANWTPGQMRNSYVLIDATGGDVITSVGFRNNGGRFQDVLIFDHVAFVPAAPAAVPEPSSLAMLGIGAAGLLGYARRRASRRCAA